MIYLTCTNCQATLEMDEAFAGGVCRCQHCGTIQTVPAHLKAASATLAPVGAGAVSQKTLFQASARGITSSGLDGLADMVASSGMANRAGSGSGMSRTVAQSSAPYNDPPSMPAPLPAAPSGRKAMMIVGGIAVLLVGVGIAVGLALSGDDKPTPAAQATPPAPTPAPVTPPRPAGGSGGAAKPASPTNSAISDFEKRFGSGGGSSSNTGGDKPAANTPKPKVDAPAPKPAAPKPAAPGSPSFCGLAIEEPSVVFLLDRSPGGKATFDALKAATVQSLRTLRPDQKFQIAFWHNGKETYIPSSGLTSASASAIDSAEKAMQGVNADKEAMMSQILKKTCEKTKPACIVIVSGKSLNTDFASTVMKQRADSTVPIHTVCISEDPTSISQLREAAEKTGGRSTSLTPKQLEGFAGR